MSAEQLFLKAEQQRAGEEYDQAVQTYQQAREQALAEGDKWHGAESAHMLGVIYLVQKNYPEANNQLDLAEQEFRQLGDQNLVGATLRDKGLVALEQQDLDKAEDLLRQSVDILKASSKTGHLGISQVKLGKLLAEKDDLDQAVQTIKLGIDNIAKSDDRYFESTAYFNLAQLQKQMGKKEQARQSAQKAKEILDQISSSNQFKKQREQIEEFLKGLNS